MISLQVPDDPNGPEVVLAAKMQHLLRLIGGFFGTRLADDQISLTTAEIGCAPSIETCPCQPEIAACLANIARSSGQVEEYEACVESRSGRWPSNASFRPR